MSQFESAYPTLPQGFDAELVRTVEIPRNPNRADSTLDTHELDLRNLFVVTEASVDFILSTLPSWYVTINQMAWKATTFAKVWRNAAVKKAMLNQACTRSEAKSDHIWADHDFVKWEGQAQWLERMAKGLQDVSLKLIQTYSANMRQQYNQGMAPPVQ